MKELNLKQKECVTGLGWQISEPVTAAVTEHNPS
jgi:hypothetical protein